MYVRIYAYMYLCMYVCKYVCTYVSMYVRTYMCMYAYTYVCMYVYIFLFFIKHASSLGVILHAIMQHAINTTCYNATGGNSWILVGDAGPVCMYVRIYVYMHLCVYKFGNYSVTHYPSSQRGKTLHHTPITAVCNLTLSLQAGTKLRHKI